MLQQIVISDPNNGNSPTSTAPAAPQPAGPSHTLPNLPYPVYVQGMPVPYAATVNTPYPAYAPPPMPQGYNPYGTLPYHNNYNFPQPGQPGSYPPGSYPTGAFPPSQQQGYQHPPW